MIGHVSSIQLLTWKKSPGLKDFMSLNCVHIMNYSSCSVLLDSNPLIKMSRANTWKEVNEALTLSPFPFSGCSDVVLLAYSTLSCLTHSSHLPLHSTAQWTRWRPSSVWRKQMLLKYKQDKERNVFTGNHWLFLVYKSYCIEFYFKSMALIFSPKRIRVPTQMSNSLTFP